MGVTLSLRVVISAGCFLKWRLLALLGLINSDVAEATTLL
jgi:hypothetical protein